jgi:transcriptional regulator with XRE-family HTH domain
MVMKPNHAIRELRKITGQTQDEFAAMIGASKDAVASWEIGRSNLSLTSARRIALVTGVDAEDLRKRRLPLIAYVPFVGHIPFTAETFALHRSTYWGRSDAQAARQHLKYCVDTLGLLFFAAALPDKGQARQQLPAVVDSFIQWCQQTRTDFGLEARIDEQLAQRKVTDTFNRSYKQWRAQAKVDPDMCRQLGFKDDPKKGDHEYLSLTLETVPPWLPGRSMRTPPASA